MNEAGIVPDLEPGTNAGGVEAPSRTYCFVVVLAVDVIDGINIVPVVDKVHAIKSHVGAPSMAVRPLTAEGAKAP
jgi:hypothetical protein